MQLSSISPFGRVFRVFPGGCFSRITTFESEEEKKRFKIPRFTRLLSSLVYVFA